MRITKNSATEPEGKIRQLALKNLFADYLITLSVSRDITVDEKVTNIKDSMPPKRRSGIYVLGYSNGHYYVGQSKNVVSRYKDHYRLCIPEAYITRVCFMPAPLKKLHEREAEVFHNLLRRLVCKKADTNSIRNEILFIEAFQKYKHLYPKTFNIREFIIQRKANSWASSTQKIEKYHSTTLPTVELINKKVQQLESRFKEFQKLPCYVEMFDVLSTYVKKAIPDAANIAGTSWICENQPVSSAAQEVYYSKFYLNNQLILTASTWKGQPRFSFILDKSAIGKRVIARLIPGKKGKNGFTTDHAIKTPAKGPIWLNILNAKTALSMLQDGSLANLLYLSNETYLKQTSSGLHPSHDQELAALLTN